MEKTVFLQRITRCGEVNHNGVVYNKEAFESALKTAFENNPRGIPVTYGSSIYNISGCIPPEEFLTVRPETIIGYVENREMVDDSEIGIFPTYQKNFYILQSLREKNYGAGLRYSGNVNILSDSIKETKDMKIIAFDILPPSSYNRTEWDK